MIRTAHRLVPAASWPKNKETGTVTLPFLQRYRRRLRLTDDDGRPFLLDLPEVTAMTHGDGLLLEDGGIIRVIAASEPVIDILCHEKLQAMRIAWHMGNRHTPVEILDSLSLRIADDHVLVRMAEGLGATIKRHKAPFFPEPGAYEGSHHPLDGKQDPYGS